MLVILQEKKKNMKSKWCLVVVICSNIKQGHISCYSAAAHGIDELMNRHSVNKWSEKLQMWLHT